MRQESSNNIRLGLMVTLGLVIFVVAIYYIGSRQNMFGNNFYISSIFKNVNGLQPGNNVRYAGINVGTVDKIVILSDSTVQVYMKMGEGVRKFIKKDAFASIGSDGLVGNMLVNISPGSGTLPPVENEDRIVSYSRTDTDDILNTLSSTNENIALLSRNLLTITENINEGKGTIAALLNDSSMTQNLQLTLHNLEKVTGSALTTIHYLESSAQKVRKGEGLLGFMLQDTTVITDLQNVIAKINQTGDHLQNTSAELEAATLALSSGHGTINTLLHDSTLSYNLRSSLSNIQESTTLLNENMKAMRENFLFRKYFKNKEKETRDSTKEKQ